MQGYDPEKALAYVQKSVARKAFAELGPAIDSILRQAQQLDLRYMREQNVIDSEGFQGEGEYDEDDALEFIVEEIVHLRGYNDDEAVLCACAVDAYLSSHEAYLRKEGLVEG